MLIPSPMRLRGTIAASNVAVQEPIAAMRPQQEHQNIAARFTGNIWLKDILHCTILRLTSEIDLQPHEIHLSRPLLYQYEQASCLTQGMHKLIETLSFCRPQFAVD